MSERELNTQASGDSDQKELQDSEGTLLYQADADFHALYDDGMERTRTKDSGEKRRLRFYNLSQLMRPTIRLKGEIVECGSWRGLSSYILCHYLKSDDTDYTGRGYNIVDSFEGLSEPTSEDVIEQQLVLLGRDRQGEAFKASGAYMASEEVVRESLSDFSGISYHRGWIPEVLVKLKRKRFKFVHIDLDLYSPILGSLEFFYPRLVPGGIIVCDDYGSLFWPGAKKAVDDFCQTNGLDFFALTTGQSVLINTGRNYKTRYMVRQGLQRLRLL